MSNTTGSKTSATNVDATAVNTVAWLADPGTTIVVPVYQRQYRWDIGGCEQLLSDIRAVSEHDDAHTHFIGSILSSHNSNPDEAALVLIDGQQRTTTLMLLIAALHHTVRDTDPALAAELERVLVRADDPDRTKLRPHREWADVFESVVLDRRSPDDAMRESRFDDNYAFFRSQIQPDEAPRIWRGLRKLEHVAITLGADANAQQTFESLNSTGAPLRDHELIHNYVLMGLTHAEQTEIEEQFWLPIEEATGEQIGTFWRHYLIMLTGREVLIEGERSVYDAFQRSFPRLELPGLRAQAAEWREYAEVYRTLLEPAREPDAEIARHLGYVGVFGKGMFPLVMREYRAHRAGAIGREELIAVLEHVQSLLLRRQIIGLPLDRLVARMCRARDESHDALVRAIARITPSDERVRVSLKYGELPHPEYVLGRLAGVDDISTAGVDHIFPLAPADDWSGDGERAWTDLTEDEQNSFRALAPTLGNLTLVEDELAEGAFAATTFADKRDAVYARSGVRISADLAAADAWSTAAVSARTERLVAEFLDIWKRPAVVLIDDDGLTPVLDAKLRRGWPRGWEREFDYVEFRGEHWEVYDVKYLFNRVFKRLWAEDRQVLVDYSDRQGGPIYPAMAWNGHWDELGEGAYLYMGWDSKYMLTAVQGLLIDAGYAPETFVKYSYIGDVM
ncbi:DUF262 domain-containing protein [Microbacterium halophytorum]|uniref:DUF262 domain-containing protein n=1 Tax=Microbacterium halophytorum TaxID=2067568 RepID=UPI000CFB60D7|nr:DUF262 domain-containing protein [Microbacterium halophytorum]